ncbi:hypothetical protein O6H91_04G032700 [Diphasiastrum complanatum]|uniref:Uncharacterized protein n=1 Tax=Diphasiastrum complanatum TaxID=34168 RepID=A0ACC2DVL9_DIPCM|nr:hypothetical protein O6H91_Y294000 [Diphasiastrum complanatum]KAJ7558296.1 hypothetical protein O6H91_04G032700 [Diphasiastrum complanatum]
MARTGSDNRSSLSNAVQRDWENRQLISALSLSVRHSFEFLLKFEATMRTKISELKSKLSEMERKVEFMEAQVQNRKKNVATAAKA